MSRFVFAAVFALIAAPAYAQDADPEERPGEATRRKKTLHAGVMLGGVAGVHPATRRRSNALIREKSPYLLQHAWNPVDWLPWGEEAFEKAKKLGKPVFLSIGYSTCHWCHVMEKESFEDFAIAEQMNRDFVCIKIDREERPDVDEGYMAVVQAMNHGGGGWPMSLFLNHDKRAFVGATYFPPEQFKDVLKRMRGVWDNRREDVEAQCLEVLDFIRKEKKGSTEIGTINKALCERAVTVLKGAFDEDYGGFQRRGPKFPRGMTTRFLLRASAREKSDKERLRIAAQTLERMAAGGMYDQIGGGFHRYSVDRRWFVPHFEKMLYDNGLLIRVYAEAYRLTGQESFLETARETSEYLLRDMQLPHGGFASAEDADSSGEEGLFYLWSCEEVRAALEDPISAQLLISHYGMKEQGNWRETPGRNILAVTKPLPALAKAMKLPLDEAERRLAAAKKKLLAQRAGRIRPLRDDKVVTAWNGLAIAGLADAARLTGDARLLTAARRAAAFVLDKLVDAETGRLRRRYRGGEARFEAVLDDYAYIVDGLLELFAADPDVRWLEAAFALEKKTRELFSDKASGGLFRVAADVKDVLVRSQDNSDGARPAPGAIAAQNMLRIAELSRDDKLAAAARKIIALEASNAAASPLGYMSILSAAEQSLAAPREIIVVATEKDDGADLMRVIHRRYAPDAVIVRIPAGPEGAKLRARLEKLCEGRVAIDGQATAYVCQNRSCKAPVTTPEALEKALEAP